MPENVAALLGEDWARPKAAADLRDQIIERGGGNPLFIEEMVRSLIEGGALGSDGSWHVEPGAGAAELPATVQGMLLARIDRLPPEVRRLAQEAAVIGPRFEAWFLPHGRLAQTWPTGSMTLWVTVILVLLVVLAQRDTLP